MKKLLLALCLILGISSTMPMYNAEAKTKKSTKTETETTETDTETGEPDGDLVELNDESVKTMLEDGYYMLMQDVEKGILRGVQEMQKFFNRSKTSASVPTEKKPVYTVTDEEYEILCRITEAETDGTLEQKQNVVSCIFSRMEYKGFPNTVRGVVFEKGQFSPISDKRYYSVKVSDRTKEAVNNVLQNGIMFTDVNGNVNTEIRYYYFCAYGTGKKSNFFKGMDSRETAMLDGTHRYYVGEY